MRNLFGIILVVFVTTGCAFTHKKYVAPSNAKVQAGINSAQSANQSAQGHNTEARTLSERIDAKDRVIEQWRLDHPQ